MAAETLPSAVDCQRSGRHGRSGVARALRSRAVQWLILVLMAGFVFNVVVAQRSAVEAALRAVGSAEWLWLPALVAAGASSYLMAAVVLNASSV